ncbi:MAG: hypothetical protein ACRC6L_11695 [Steroidobacteraceae bacterium]
MQDVWTGSRGSLVALVAWAIMAAIWNFAGVWRVANGQSALGPTASIAGGLVLIASIAALVGTARRWPLVYMLLAVACGLIAFSAVAGAFLKDPAFWPSEFWRYAGIAINAFGVAAAAAGAIAYVRWKSAR